MIKAYLNAGWIVWIARVATVALLSVAPWSIEGMLLLSVCFLVLDCALCARTARLERAVHALADWRAGSHDAPTPRAGDVGRDRPAFEVPKRFENDPATQSSTQASI